MIGVWPKSTGLIGATGRDQVTSVIALYGPRTTVLVALDDGVYEFTYGAIPEGSNLDPKETPWICTRHEIQINEDSKIFSPANLRSAQDLPGYQDLVNYYMSKRYTLRCKWVCCDIRLLPLLGCFDLLFLTCESEFRCRHWRLGPGCIPTIYQKDGHLL